ncbi:MAG: hypothetical protein NZ805_04445 [Armatimonadetes bacterium]|nr:hypothetical protein [Armatimonadota bacterium]MDW8027880.1 hypothetical protein [Armatimonadota bacterium]
MKIDSRFQNLALQWLSKNLETIGLKEAYRKLAFAILKSQGQKVSNQPICLKLCFAQSAGERIPCW